MDSCVWFSSRKFAPVPGEEELTNPGRLGESLARWLQERLISRGVSVSEVLAEDWGWLVMLHRKPFMLWVGCGNEDGSTERWCLFAEAEVPWLKRLFGGVDTKPALVDLRTHLEAIVAEDPEIADVAWE